MNSPRLGALDINFLYTSWKHSLKVISHSFSKLLYIVNYFLEALKYNSFG